MVSSSPYHANLIILSWSTNSVRLVCRFDRHIDKDTHCFRSKYFFLSYEFWLELIKVYDYHTVLNSLKNILDIFCIHFERGPRLLLDYFHIYFYHWLNNEFLMTNESAVVMIFMHIYIIFTYAFNSHFFRQSFL